MPSRRAFVQLGVAVSASLAAESVSPAQPSSETGIVSLNGDWQFSLDPHSSTTPPGGNLPWRTVKVPHTWQVEPDNAGYMGAAWYRRILDAPDSWAAQFLRLEFEAVFHTATVWINGVRAGAHAGKGYTAFTIDLTPHLRFGSPNTIAVHVDNSFHDLMLPRAQSSDWAHDGGIYRPVQLLLTPKIFIERLAIDATPDLTTREASINVTAIVRNASTEAWAGHISIHIAAEASGRTSLDAPAAAPVKLAAGETRSITIPTQKLPNAQLWHFDHPHLYRLSAQLSNGHREQSTFGIRKIETRGTHFYLNGERVRLMGVERMAGSNPEYGMAEPLSWLTHDHADMKNLNCVYSRVHWPQDRRVLDWCDRHGILLQTEVPAWGPRTFEGMTAEPLPAILDNALEQLREMIARDRNHPCIFSWGVCNEINGQNPPAYAFAKRLYEEAKRLDPRRLVTYASHSLRQTPEKDVSGLMDYIMWNEYYESWTPGTAGDMARNLDAIHRAFPEKPIVISEYGYCACTAARPEGDASRAAVLRGHDRIFRQRDYVAGLIFFDYNDYRTHVGDRGAGVMKQRVHGVVDVYGAKKPSWDVLRRESSPVESLRATGNPGALKIAIQARSTVPAYSLNGYSLRAIAYGFGGIPVERAAIPLETIAPGETASAELKFNTPGITRIQLDVMRPTGFSAATEVWQY